MIDDYAYATGRARALEAKIRAVETIAPSQILKEYGLDEKALDASIDRLMEKNFSEFTESAPEAVLPFRILADLQNMKSFIRISKKRGEAMFSKLGTFVMGEKQDETSTKLKDAGYGEVAEKLKGLTEMNPRDSDLWLEQYFTGRIQNKFFKEFLSFRRNYLETEEAPEDFYKRMSDFIKENSMLKNMHIDVITAFLLLKQRELELARARVIGAREVIS
ncbi:MAG: hypothetical protein ABIG39_02895 [Candidatus Micrarchaeota archaeon]